LVITGQWWYHINHLLSIDSTFNFSNFLTDFITISCPVWPHTVSTQTQILLLQSTWFFPCYTLIFIIYFQVFTCKEFLHCAHVNHLMLYTVINTRTSYLFYINNKLRYCYIYIYMCVCVCLSIRDFSAIYFRFT